MELHQALAQIPDIHAHIAQSETFRGYRSATVAGSGCLALIGGVVQSIWIPDPLNQVAAYLTLWVGIAAVCLAAVGVELAVRSQRVRSPLSRHMTRLAVEQFAPCVVAGALLTWSVWRFAAESVWMLPGLWSIVCSLGVFASWRLLPKAVGWIAVFYMAAGVLCFCWARGETALSPWTMVGTFGVGQLATAAILFVTLERSDERS